MAEMEIIYWKKCCFKNYLNKYVKVYLKELTISLKFVYNSVLF